MKLKRRIQKIMVLILKLRHRFHWSVHYTIRSQDLGIESFDSKFYKKFYENSQEYARYLLMFNNLLFFIDAFIEFDSTESPLQLIGIYNSMYYV